MGGAAIHSNDYLVKPSESNAQQELPLSLLVAQMIDLATDHANKLGIGFLMLEPKGLGWVLSRLSVEMKRWPATGESYTLSTWVETYNSHFSERCFSVVSSTGDVLGYGRTIWMIIDLKTHRSVGTGGTHLDEDIINPVECPMARIGRHRPFTPEKEVVYTFKYTDLDFYRHVNTVKYISLLLNQFTLEEFDSNLLSRFDIAFAHEAKYGEKAVIKSITENHTEIIQEAGERIIMKRSFEITIENQPILTSSITLKTKEEVGG